VKLRYTRSLNQPNAKIRIVAVPPGEAPLWVRQQWVGLELPLTRYTGLKRALGFGVLSGPPGWIGQIWGALVGRAVLAKGYAVEGAKAVEVLESSSPDAAAWWREHAPHYIAPGRYLLFHDHFCQLVAD
jgi:hypothetical protein